MLTRPSSRTSRPHSSRASRIAAAVQRLAAIDVAAGEHPLAVAGLDRALARARCDRTRRLDDRADGDLRIEVEDEPARACRPAVPARWPSAAGARAPRRTAGRNGTRARRRADARTSITQVPRATQYNSAVMSILKVARMGHPVLRAKARPIERGEIKSAAVQKLIDDMIETMVEYHGVGLAAPQVHEGLRLFVGVARRARRRTSERMPSRSPSSTPRSRRRRRHRRGLGRLPEHSRHPRAACRARARSRSARSIGRASASSCAPTIFRRASSSTKPIISTAFCSSIACARSSR